MLFVHLRSLTAAEYIQAVNALDGAARFIANTRADDEFPNQNHYDRHFAEFRAMTWLGLPQQ